MKTEKKNIADCSSSVHQCPEEIKTKRHRYEFIFHPVVKVCTQGSVPTADQHCNDKKLAAKANTNAVVMVNRWQIK